MTASIALRPVLIPQLVCAMQATTALTMEPLAQRHRASRFAQKVAIASKALHGPSTARVATTTPNRAKRPSSIVFSVCQVAGALVRPLLSLTETVTTVIIAWLPLRSRSSGLHRLDLTQIPAMTGSCRYRRVTWVTIRISGIKVNAQSALRVSTAELKASPTISLHAQSVTIVRKRRLTL